jgi:hypothetical protein
VLQRVAEHKAEQDRLAEERRVAEAKRLEDERAAKVLAAQQTISPQDILVTQENELPIDEHKPDLDEYDKFVRLHEQNKEKALSQYQRGFKAGLELAINIALKAEIKRTSAMKAIQLFIDADDSVIPDEKAA